MNDTPLSWPWTTYLCRDHEWHTFVVTMDDTPFSWPWTTDLCCDHENLKLWSNHDKKNSHRRFDTLIISTHNLSLQGSVHKPPSLSVEGFVPITQCKKKYILHETEVPKNWCFLFLERNTGMRTSWDGFSKIRLFNMLPGSEISYFGDNDLSLLQLRPGGYDSNNRSERFRDKKN